MKMKEIKVAGQDPECGLEGEEIMLLEGGREYEVTATGETDEDRIKFNSTEIPTGFLDCGEGMLNGKKVDVYYVVDMDNTDLSDALFILEGDI